MQTHRLSNGNFFVETAAWTNVLLVIPRYLFLPDVLREHFPVFQDPTVKAQIEVVFVAGELYFLFELERSILQLLRDLVATDDGCVCRVCIGRAVFDLLFKSCDAPRVTFCVAVSCNAEGFTGIRVTLDGS